ncbi:capsular polysaccharide biosynthesis protein CapM [Rhodonellum psychrophilum GCM71 = DSM 17998]|uniref:Capsular polysaccharide biosynthesis protein CapM n=2 Tax=Rhodonellum TaxID=336827 RepID=U5C6W3_9BACT|nr:MULTISPECIES: glycosyltransferase family 4 protein [Rhodonellum]ERM83922.1 capsular polysaccharide biosynthesis protein CapM [Rhodonellum psychrophilum GCM71 = DSM 17998]MDO9550907.1 glycosyltransferase family 4 protein [Rhodonellum sp.]SDZ05005.1 Glycosyltransferase involved in cell wall bisynthesis [Rhodonellum ikkaensis]
MPKLIRVTTVPLSLKLLLAGQMKFMKESGFDVLMVSADGREVNEVVKREGCPHQVIPFTRKITIFQDIYCLWLLYWLFKKEKPDIVHSHTPKAGLLSMIAAKFAGVKIRVHTVAGMPYMVADKQRKKILIAMEKLTFHWATEVWSNSQSLMKFILEEKLLDSQKIKVIGEGSSNGVDLEKFNRGALAENHLIAATMRIMPGENDFIILAVGRLVRDKGIEQLVTAFLDSKIVNQSKLVLLGSFEQQLNPLDEEIVRKIQDHPRIVHVEWTDHVAHYMALSDVLVHASHREGFPNVLLEAAAMQLPVICSDIIGNIDVVTQRETGLIFPAKNVEILKEALEFSFVKRDDLQVLADNLYLEVTHKYSRPRIHQLILENYQRLNADALD